MILKLGRSYHNVREALSASGQLDGTFYVERASTAKQRVLPAADVEETSVPYFSLAMLPGGRKRASVTGTVAVVGLGPGGCDWMTPQTRRELADATDLVGYATYLDRVPPREGSAAIPATTPTNPPAPGWPARWPSKVAPWRWCPPAIPACSRWQPQFSKRPGNGRACRFG